MQRSAVVRPDMVIDGVGREVLCASRDAILDAVVRAVDTMILCGGQFTVSSQRVPTGFENESVCAAVLVQWENHPAAKPQPEPHVEPVEVAEDSLGEQEPVEESDEDREPVAAG